MPSRPTSERIRRILDGLEAEYGRVRFLNRFEPMEELVSCILSQHTTDANSFPAFVRLRAAFPDWNALADAPPEAVIPLIQNAGLANNKAKLIQGCLRGLRDRFGQPTLEPIRAMADDEARSLLLSLPGVGPKTAAIVLCFAFGRHAIPVDTHVYRVSRRLRVIPSTVNEIRAHDRLLRLVPDREAFRYHTLLIQHGRHICRAPRPECGRCPIAELCPSAGREQKPTKRTSRKRPAAP